MIKNRKPAVIIGIFLSIIILFLIFGTPGYQSIKIKNKSFGDTENNIKEACSKNNTIDLKKLTNFDWDECYIFTPYYPSEKVYEKTGTEWTTYRTYIGFLMFHGMENETVSDDQYLIVFKKDSRVILSAKYSLSQLPVIFRPDGCRIIVNNSRFQVTSSKQYNDSRVKELIPAK